MRSTASSMRRCPEPRILAEWVISADPVGLHHLAKCRDCAKTAGELDSVVTMLAVHAEEIFDLETELADEFHDEVGPSVARVPGKLQAYAQPLSKFISIVRDRRRHFVAAIVAGLAVCVGALLTTPVQFPPGGELRGQTTTLTASATFEPSTRILNLVWREDALADRYVVRVWNGEGELLEERTLSAPAAEFDLLIRSAVIRTYWAIDAWAGHSRVRRSGMGETDLIHQ